MHTSHVSSGGRYPVLRTLAILYLVAACAVLVAGVWRAIRVLTVNDPSGFDMFGATPDMGSRLLSAFSWLAASFIGVLAMFAVAELIKLAIDIEHNTRLMAMRSATTAGADAAAVVVPTDTGAAVAVVTPAGDGVAPAAPAATAPAGGRIGQWLEGEETAEGALLRGH
jgi:hypothetical protein